MARLPYLEADQVAPEYRDMLKRNTNLHKLLVNSPDMARAFNGVGNYIRFKSKLDPRLRELAIMTVGRLTDCEYEYVHHQAFARRVGVRPEQVGRLAAWESDPAFNEQERAVIRYATEVTQQVRVSDATFDALRGFLDAEQIVELALNVGFYNMVVRFLLPMQVDLEPEARKQS
jgi:AhpD family alkylhydroperoxidase